MQIGTENILDISEFCQRVEGRGLIIAFVHKPYLISSQYF